MAKPLEGTLTGIFICSRPKTLVSERKDIVRVLNNGLEHDRHTSWFRGADKRAPFYKKGTKIWNSRQISIVSEEELKEIAENMNIPEIKPEWLGTNLCLKGIPDLTLLPPGTTIYSPDLYGGQDVGLYITALNKPCIHPGKVIQENYPDIPKLALNFSKAAHELRGVVAIVEQPGCIQTGSSVKVWIPDQYQY